MKNGLWEIVGGEKGKAGFIKAMVWHFQEYDKYPFLYNSATPDFLAFMNKLPTDRIEKLKFYSVSFFYDTIELADLTLKVDKEKAYAVISTLLLTVTLKERYDRIKVFEFLLNSVIEELFE
ncbi:hypothetical protein RE628_21185 [Paenibacillus sp. D2_2]|uniref:hypothetical protein n=1 Tax=Paenibacillus sp. D2_2 TaxID=3073092 RepID=UPI002814D34E|nr:hypothetical protein [Paenibacillus sp. D2_2]WMT39852.1 hypothetical protein RE628_21185 [Paenibacillus sp. D2_2]